MATKGWLRITGGAVIDGSGDPPLPSCDVIVSGDRIVAVGDRKLPDVQIPPAEQMETVDANGMTVMPGLIDSHCHMSYGAGQTQEEIDMYTSHELKMLLAALNAEKVLRAGVTSVSSPGGSYFIDVGVREGVNRGWIRGPRVKASGRYLTTSNGLTDWYPTSVGVPDGSIGRLTNTVDEMKDEIRRQVKNGVDLIKLSDSAYGQLQAFTNDELKQVAEMSHNLGRPCTIHARGSDEVSASIDAGFDWIMHGNVMTDDVIEKLAESGIPLVPTLLLLANRADWPALTGGSQHVVDGARRMLDRSASTYHKAVEAGVTFVMGSDTGFSVTPYGEWHARELELMSTYCGLSPLQLLATATKNGARIMGLHGQLGELAPGYLADIIVVNGDPATNVGVLINKRNIVTVVKDGNVVEFTPGLDDRSFHVDRLPIVYSTGELTYDMVYAGSEGTTYRTLPWNADDAKDLARDLARAESQPVHH